MSELGLDSRYNYIDLLKMKGEDGKMLDPGTGLFEKNEMLYDAFIAPATGETSHQGLRSTSLPGAQIVKIGDGWDSSTAKWDPFKDDISMFKMRAQFPEDDLRLAGDMAAKRTKIESQHMEGFGQSVINHIIYGSSAADPEKFDGLGVRYNTPDATDPWAPTSAGQYGVLDMGGTGSDTTSIWLVQWGDDYCSLRTPKNDPKMGIFREDMGRHMVTAENSKQRWDYVTEFRWDLGISIQDIRSVVRIRNIESAVSAISTDLPKKIMEAREMFNGSAPVFMYTNRRIRTHLKVLYEGKQNVLYSAENPYNIKLLMFDDMVVRRNDAITNTEAAVAAA